ncbi:hypothetical protein YERSI8AC_100009 [Enterobacterales bacterium 8AC]|nr:hypothetical protein YERSI8AC_100009 [Enterobacterales bacterium 8AC]
MRHAQRQAGELAAAALQPGVVEVVAIDTVRQAQRQAGFYLTVAEHDAGQVETVRLAVAAGAPVEALIVDGREVVAVGIVVIRQPVAVRQADTRLHAAGVVIAGEIAAARAGDKPLIRQPQQVIAGQRAVDLPGAGAFLPAVIEPQPQHHREFRRGGQVHHRIARLAARQDFNLDRLLTQAVDLLHALFDIAQVKDSAHQAGERHLQHAVIAFIQLDLLQLAFKNEKLQFPARQILLSEERAAGDVTARDIPVGDLLYQGLDLRQIQAALEIRLRERLLRAGRQVSGTLKTDGIEGETGATFSRNGWGLWARRGNAALQLLALLLVLLQQITLLLLDGVAIGGAEKRA